MSHQVSWTKQLILAVALFSLGTFAYWLEYKHKPEVETAAANAKKMFQIKGHQIQTIQLVNGGKTFEWKCGTLKTKTCKPGDNSRWNLSQPVQVRADDSNVNSLVSTLENLTPADTIDLKTETPAKRASLLKEYGLSPDALQSASVRRISVTTGGGSETIAYLGTTNPINGNYFALLERTPAAQASAAKPDLTKVYLIPSYFKGSFDHDLTYWRDKKLFSFSSSDIDSFEIHSRAHGTLTATRKNGEWTLKTKEGEFSGDTENIESLLNAGSYLTAKDFVSDSHNDAKAKATLKGLSEVLSVTFHPTQGTSKKAPEPLTLTLYSRPEKKAGPAHSKGHGLAQGTSHTAEVYAIATNDDPLYELQSSSLKQFDKTLKDLRLSKLITSMDRFGTERIEFSGTPIGAKPLTLVSKKDKWLNAADNSAVKADKVQTTLDDLSGNKIKKFLTGSSIPAGEKDGLKVTLGDSKTPAKRKLVFWKKDGKLYARDLNSKRKEAFLVDSSVMNGLPWNRAFYSASSKKM